MLLMAGVVEASYHPPALFPNPESHTEAPVVLLRALIPVSSCDRRRRRRPHVSPEHFITLFPPLKPAPPGTRVLISIPTVSHAGPDSFHDDGLILKSISSHPHPHHHDLPLDPRLRLLPQVQKVRTSVQEKDTRRSVQF